MEHHPLNNSRFYSAYAVGPRRHDPEHCQWAVVIGDRIRRIRTARGWLLRDLAERVRRPDGHRYSLGYFSKIERGWATAPLYAYLAVAAALDVDPGRLFGSDAAMLDASEAEITLLRTVRSLGLEPHEALAILAAQARATPILSSSPSMRAESAGAPSPS